MSSGTLYDKVWELHRVADLPGGSTQLLIGLHLIHEVTSPQAFAALDDKLVIKGGKRLRAGDLVDQMQTDQQLGGTAGKICHTVQFPDFVVKRAAAHSGAVISESP